MKKISPGALAALVAGALMAAPAAAAPGDVAVRVEGGSQTLLPRTVVRTTAAPVGKPGQPTCSGTSALGALDRATNGNWAGPYDPGFASYNVKALMGETHDDATSSYWAFWINYTYASAGVCGQQTQQGDDLLFVPECYAAGCIPASPLRITGLPAQVAPDTPVTVKVVQYSPPVYPATQTTSAPAAGATLSTGGEGTTTGADGTAQLMFSGSGAKTVQATKPGHVRSAAESTCVTKGSDGSCGTPDTEAPVASFARLENGKVFKRKRAPRKIEGSVTDDPSGLLSVRLSIVRKRGHRCWAFSGTSERFKRHRCRGSRSFRIGDRAEWSYLLPKRLGKGRYKIRAVVVDKAGNDSSTRVAIRVR
jgi:hypothetical protein